MEHRIKLVVPLEVLSRSRSGSIYGQICIQVGQEAFPNKSWNDLAVGFVCAWIAAILRLKAAEKGTERVRFMDGPYLINLIKTKADEDNVTVEFVSDRLTGPVLCHSATANLNELLHDARLLGNGILAICQANGWKNTDTDELGRLASL